MTDVNKNPVFEEHTAGDVIHITNFSDVSTASSENSNKHLNANVTPLLGSSSYTSVSSHGSSHLTSHGSSVTSESSSCQGVKQKTAVKKKKGGHVVCSRYKQAASHFNAERSIIPKEKTKITKTRTGDAPELSSTTKRLPFTAKKKVGRLPIGKSGNIVSTPAFNLSTSLAPVQDVSSIIAPPSCRKQLGPQFTKTGVKSKFIKHRDKTHTPCQIPEFDEMKETEKQSGETISDIEMHNIYCQYLQAVALEVMAKQSSEERSKDAMRQIFSLWKLNDSLSDQLAKLDKELQTVRQIQQFEQFLERQKEDLSPVVSALDEIESDYRSLAEGLDKVRHQLPLSNIIVPPGGQENEILGNALDETSSILQDTFTSLELLCNDATSTSDGFQNLVHTVETEANALERCKDTLDVLKRMTIYESSLRIQKMQTSEIS